MAGYFFDDYTSDYFFDSYFFKSSQATNLNYPLAAEFSMTTSTAEFSQNIFLAEVDQ